jgi:hypothetical protein
VQVQINGGLVAGKDYTQTVTYEHNIHLGKNTAVVKVVLTGTGSAQAGYTGSVTLTQRFSIVLATPTVKGVKKVKKGVRVALSKPVKGATHYKVFYATKANGKYKSKQVAAKGKTLTIPGLKGKRYYVKVQAVAMPTWHNIGAQRQLKPGAGNRLVIDWQALPNATAYRVEYRVKGTKKWSTKTVSKNKAQVTLTKLKRGKTYQIRVAFKAARYLSI